MLSPTSTRHEFGDRIGPGTSLATSVAAIALAVAVAGVFYWRSYQTTPLTDKDTIVLADFCQHDR